MDVISSGQVVHDGWHVQRVREALVPCPEAEGTAAEWSASSSATNHGQATTTWGGEFNGWCAPCCSSQFLRYHILVLLSMAFEQGEDVSGEPNKSNLQFLQNSSKFLQLAARWQMDVCLFRRRKQRTPCLRGEMDSERSAADQGT